MLIVILAWVAALRASDKGAEAELSAVLDSLHQAASEADGETYFGLFTEDAIFIGTDASERWSIAEFRAFADPYFSQGRGWTYEVLSRNLSIAAGGATAWFDEMLHNESYGKCRGTGVLVLEGGRWRIVQYHLTIPIPNDLARQITDMIKEFGNAGN